MNTNPLRWLAIAAAVISVTACSLEGDEFDPSIMTPSAIVTVKPDAENTYFWMQLNDETVLHAVNMKTSPFGTKEVRALVNYRKPTAEEMQKGGLYDDAGNVYVNWMDSIRTKKPVPDLGPQGRFYGPCFRPESGTVFPPLSPAGIYRKSTICNQRDMSS